MRDWGIVIDELEKSGDLSEKVASDLREEYEELKTAGLNPLKPLKWAFNKGKDIANTAAKGYKNFVKDPGNMQSLIVAGIGLPVAAQAGSNLMRPMKNKRLYDRMREHLDEIAPSISRTYDEAHIQKVYNIVSHFSPTIASNPIAAAAVVKESIELPDTISLQKLKQMADIEKAVTGRGGNMPGLANQASKELTGFVGSNAFDTLQTASDISALGG